MEPRDTGAIKASLSDQWRKYVAAKKSSTTIVLLTLPSGMQVRATRPHLLLLLRTGRIPDALTPRVEEMIAIGKKAADSGSPDGADARAEQAGKAYIAQKANDNPADFNSQWENLLDVVWSEAVVDPRFTCHPKLNPNMLLAADVEIDDKTYLYVWCQGVDESVQDYLFRRERESASLESPPTGDDVQPGPGDAAGNQPTDG